MSDHDDQPKDSPASPMGALGQEGQEGTETGGQGGRGGRGGAPGLPGKKGDQGEEGPAGPVTDVQTRAGKIALFLVVAITALSAIYFSTEASQRLDQAEQDRVELNEDQAALDADQADFDKQVSCQQDVLAATLEGLKARSQFAEQQAETTLAGLIAQRDFLVSLARPGATEEEGVVVFETYLKSITIQIKAIKEQLLIRDNNPYPTLEEIESCSQHRP